MSQTNHERVGRALEILNKGLKPFVEREMQAEYADRWRQEATKSLRDHHLSNESEDAHLDTQGLLLIMWDQWQPVFREILGQAERSLVSELRETRNRWAHQKSFSTDDVYRALDSVQRLLTAISAEEAREIERQKQEVLRIRFDEQARRETRKVAVAPIEGQPAIGLRPWREVVTPHPDVASGRYQQAEFAADLGQVYRGEGVVEYRLPRDFFQRTFLTEGLRHLLTGALQRLNGTGGDPVVELQTNFGGGKTHSMLALYHLFSGERASNLPGIEPILVAADVSQPPQARRAVLVGTALSPAQPHSTPDGTVIHTLWGELAWQLLGRDGYSLVAEADRLGVSPGSDALRELFTRAAPCLVLIDEWVAFARQLYRKSDLPAGSFEANMTFAQALTEAARAVPRTLVVASIPASDIETGGEGGHEALTRLRNTFGRIESTWRPASTEEGFEIVRRRLFQPPADSTLFTARDAVVKAFADLYRNQSQEFPSACREADYERRVKAAYPIHPELFDRLYNDWSSIDKFQRTRGVLRLMAAVIHTLWERQDASLLILPASVPMDASRVQDELTRYLDDPWMPVIERDVDGPNSLPLRLDRENANLGRYSACRRVARTIYLGSAPTLRNPNKGLTDSQVKLGCVQPGESVATFGDALRRLTDQSTHLYLDGQRYWYSTQPSVTRLAQDRAEQLDEDTVFEEIQRRLKSEEKARGDFGRVHVCPSSSADIPEDHAARLVILKSRFTHALRDQHTAALQEARKILDTRGNSLRTNRNTLVFLAADRTRLEELKQRVRQYLAWKSIYEERVTLNLDPFQQKQAETKLEGAQEAVEKRIPETYVWLLVPNQDDPRGSMQWVEFRLQPQEKLALAAARRLKQEEMLITQWAGTLLQLELNRIPLWRGDHVNIKLLADDFAQYLYLPRLKDTDVLLGAITNGLESLVWERETFAYADSWDANRNRYRGLKAGQHLTITQNAECLLVKPEGAAKQLAAESAPSLQAVPTGTTGTTGTTVPTSMTYTPGQIRPNPVVVERGANGVQDQPSPDASPTLFPPATPGLISTAPPVPSAPQLHRFHGSIKLRPLLMGGDAGKISDEVVKHLVALLGSKVEVTLEIHAELPENVPDATVRTVTENCRTLHFESYGFEET